MLDVGGASQLFGGEAGLVAAVEAGLRRQGLACRAAVASTPEAAWAFARFGAEAAKTAPAPADPGFEALAAALPLAALRLEPETVAGLGRAGLARVGDLLGRPRAPVAARYGAEVLRRLDGLMGLRLSPIAPRFPAPRSVAERRFAAGLTRADAIEAALLPLCRHLCAALARRGEGARTVEASFFRVDGAVKHLRLGTSRPTRDPEALFRLFRERIAALGEDGLDTGYGFDLIRLAVAEAERLDARQDGLDPEDAPAGADAFGRPRRPARGAAGAPARAAPRRPRQPPRPNAPWWRCPSPAEPSARRPAPSRRPPCAGRSACSSAPSRSTRWPPCRTGRPCGSAGGRSSTTSPPSRGRSGSRRDGGPARRELTRDYFRAEDRDGRRYWLYREGLFGRETDRPRWFLHGLFG